MPYFKRLQWVRELWFGQLTAKSLKEPMAFRRSTNGFQLASIRETELSITAHKAADSGKRDR
jgi:hypothetical protein